MNPYMSIYMLDV